MNEQFLSQDIWIVTYSEVIKILYIVRGFLILAYYIKLSNLVSCSLDCIYSNYAHVMEH